MAKIDDEDPKPPQPQPLGPLRQIAADQRQIVIAVTNISLALVNERNSQRRFRREMRLRVSSLGGTAADAASGDGHPRVGDRGEEISDVFPLPLAGFSLQATKAAQKKVAGKVFSGVMLLVLWLLSHVVHFFLADRYLPAERTAPGAVAPQLPSGAEVRPAIPVPALQPPKIP